VGLVGDAGVALGVAATLAPAEGGSVTESDRRSPGVVAATRIT
jgi:hypothetical protein